MHLNNKPLKGRTNPNRTDLKIKKYQAIDNKLLAMNLPQGALARYEKGVASVVQYNKIDQKADHDALK